jgi:hypothetical protein
MITRGYNTRPIPSARSSATGMSTTLYPSRTDTTGVPSAWTSPTSRRTFSRTSASSSTEQAFSRRAALISGPHAESVGLPLCVCRLEQLDHRAADEHRAVEHIRALDVKPTQLLINELQREVV